MKLVIDISEEDYEYIKNSNDMNFNAIKNGTPLPKGHGRLIDADELLEEINQFDYYDNVREAPTIIEADKGE